MRNRPPLRTAEIVAYNWGAQARAAGIAAAGLLPLEGYPLAAALSIQELEALGRLGPDAWERWSLKGWIETQPEGGIE